MTYNIQSLQHLVYSRETQLCSVLEKKVLSRNHSLHAKQYGQAASCKLFAVVASATSISSRPRGDLRLMYSHRTGEDDGLSRIPKMRVGD